MTGVDRLAQNSHRIAQAALCLGVGILLLNAVVWYVPSLGSVEGGAGLSFALTQRMQEQFSELLLGMPGWQTLGAVLISSVPLLAMVYGLLHVRALFAQYAQGQYFSATAYQHLEKLGRSLVAWVVLNFLCEPLLSVWLSMRAEPGQRILSLSLDPMALGVVFLSVCLIAIARILQRASDLHAENQQFV